MIKQRNAKKLFQSLSVSQLPKLDKNSSRLKNSSPTPYFGNSQEQLSLTKPVTSMDVHQTPKQSQKQKSYFKSHHKTR